MARKRTIRIEDYDLGLHSPQSEDAMVRKTHGEATVGDEPTTESFRRKVQAMERGEDKRIIVEAPSIPASPTTPRLSPSDILRAAVYGDAIFSPPPAAAYFQRRRNPQ